MPKVPTPVDLRFAPDDYAVVRWPTGWVYAAPLAACSAVEGAELVLVCDRARAIQLAFAAPVTT